MRGFLTLSARAWRFLTVSVFVFSLLVSASAVALPATGKAPKVEPKSDPNGSILWQGFHHKWQKTPHRLNRIGSYFRHIDYDEATDSVTGEHRAIFRVGAYNDTGSVKSTGTYFRSTALGLYNGYIDESCLHVSGDVGTQHSVTCGETVDLTTAGLKNYDHVTVVLTGFQLTATSYTTGYNTRGFAVRVIPGAQTRDDFQFNAYLSVHPEHSPDRPQLDDKCWQDDHCKHYRYEGRIYYTLIGVNDSDGAITEPDSSDATNHYERRISMSPNEIPAQAPDYMREAHIEGETGFAQGLVGIQGFSWHLADWSQVWSEGRYIRDLQMNISDIAYNSDQGNVDFMTNMYFSNSGALPLGFDVTFKMWNTLIQFNDDDYAHSDKTWFSGTITKGGSDFVEPIDYGF